MPLFRSRSFDSGIAFYNTDPCFFLHPGLYGSIYSLIIVMGSFQEKLSQIRKKNRACQSTITSFSNVRRLVWGLNSQGKPTNMIQDIPLAFLSEKIKELENALFMSESNALISLPTHIVRITEVDREGNIWFIIPRPTQVIESFSKEMPAKLDFFKKGKDFFLKVSGVATIICSVLEMNGTSLTKQFTDSIEKNNMVAVKVKVESSELVEKTPRPSTNPIYYVGSQVYNWLLNPLFNA